MKIIRGVNNYQRAKLKSPIVVAIGNFDGVHLGHQKVINTATVLAERLAGSSVVLTFEPHPLKILKTKKQVAILTSIKHKISLISEFGPNVCLIVNFKEQFAVKSPAYFTEKFLKQKIKADFIIVGEKFNFGKDKTGDIKFLAAEAKKLSFQIKLIPALKKTGLTISSTLIRDLIKKSEFKKVKSMLGRDFSIVGTVVGGDGRGRRLGFPTANIDPHQEALPCVGVYAVEAKINKKIYQGMLNIGFRPTFYKKTKIQVIEVCIFGFDTNIYKREVEVIFKAKIREEKLFPNIEALKRQLNKDKQKALKILNS